MKTLSLIILFAMSASAYASGAKASLKYPVVFENGKKMSLVSSLNKKITKAGFKAIPDSVELTSSEQGYKALNDMSAQIEKIGTSTGIKGLEMVQYSMSAVTSTDLTIRLCYTGDAIAAVDLINNLADAAFSDQQQVYGYKYKSKKWVSDSLTEKENPDMFTKNWKEWRGKGEALLILWSEGDDGDDVNEAIIPKCLN